MAATMAKSLMAPVNFGLDFGVDHPVELQFDEQGVDAEHDDHGVDPHGKAGKCGDAGAFKQIEGRISEAAAAQHQGQVEGGRLNGGVHKGLPAHGTLLGDVGSIPFRHGGGDVAWLFQDGSFALFGRHVNGDNADDHAADDADGGSGDGDALCGSPVLDAQALQNFAYGTGSSMAAGVACGELIPKGAVQLIFAAAKVGEEKVGAVADHVLQGANGGEQTEGFEHIGSGLAAHASGLAAAVHEHAQRYRGENRNNQDAGEQGPGVDPILGDADDGVIPHDNGAKQQADESADDRCWQEKLLEQFYLSSQEGAQQQKAAENG